MNPRIWVFVVRLIVTSVLDVKTTTEAVWIIWPAIFSRCENCFENIALVFSHGLNPDNPFEFDYNEIEEDFKGIEKILIDQDDANVASASQVRLRCKGFEEAAKRLGIEITELGNRIEFYIPSKDKYGTPIDQDGFSGEIERFFSTNFGGSTQFCCSGCYFGENEILMKEDVKVVYAGIDGNSSIDHEKLLSYFHVLKGRMNQEMVAFGWNEKIFLI